VAKGGNVAAQPLKLRASAVSISLQVAVALGRGILGLLYVAGSGLLDAPGFMRGLDVRPRLLCSALVFAGGVAPVLHLPGRSGAGRSSDQGDGDGDGDHALPSARWA
jgi:hypothetical protein